MSVNSSIILCNAMKFIVLLIFVVITCGENFNNLLDTVCRSFCKLRGQSTCVDDYCICTGENFSVGGFGNSSCDLYIKKPHLRCKEDNLINLFWESEDDFEYFLEVLAEDRRFYYNVTLCDSYTIGDLTEDTIYKIRLWGESYSKEKMLCSDVLDVRSSKINYNPSPVDYITVGNLTFTEDQKDGNFNAVVLWGPNKDYSCEYELVWDNEGIETAIINVISNSYEFQIENLQFDKEYAVAITARAKEGESVKKFFNISTPSCLSSYNGSMDKCVPECPQGLMVSESMVDVLGKNSVYDVSLTWEKPNWPPTYYNACMVNVNPGNDFGTEERKCITVDGSKVTAIFKRVELLEDYYHVSISACSSAGCNTDSTLRHRSPTSNIIEKKHLWRTLGLVLITICTFTTIIIVITLIILIKRHRDRRERKEERYRYFTELEEKVPETANNLEVDAIIKQDPLVDHWELDSNKLHFESVLGEGAFGIVRRGCLEMKDDSKMEVAIKMLKDSPSSEEVRQFTQEIEIMKSVRQHPYIVSLIGCVTRGRPEGPLLVVEYCSRGDLQSYLRAAWDKFSNMQRDVIYMDSECNISPHYFANRTYDFHNVDHADEFIIQPKHLLSIARQVALGMEHLANTRVVHRDLAARNVLVCKNHTVKVSDFGLSRDVYQDNVYCKSGGGKLPIRWMALESLTHQRYTTQSDVWSFGILLWEIVTLGGTPYVGIHTCDLLDLLKRGYRLKCPSTCSPDLYTIMQNCWKASPKDRPTFSELCKSIEILLENVSQYLHVENGQPLSNNFNNLKSTKVNNGTCSYERYIKPISNIFK